MTCPHDLLNLTHLFVLEPRRYTPRSSKAMLFSSSYLLVFRIYRGKDNMIYSIVYFLRRFKFNSKRHNYGYFWKYIFLIINGLLTKQYHANLKRLVSLKWVYSYSHVNKTPLLFLPPF